MTEFRVTWEMDIEADSPREAAEKALEIQRDAASIATVFTATRASDGQVNHIDLQYAEDQS